MAAAVTSALLRLSAGEELSAVLRDSHCGPSCGPALADALRAAPASAVRELDLYGCDLADSALPLLQALGERPRGSPSTVDLGDNGLSLHAAAAIAPLLHAANVDAPALRCLRLSRNFLHGEATAVLLAPPLAPDGRLSLELLALGFNPLGEKGGAALGAALSSKRLPELRALQLPGCALGSAGATALAAGLASAAALVHLDLSDNGIGDAGCGALAAQIPYATLEELVLARNRLGDAAADALAGALTRRRGCRLRLLSLASNAVRDPGAAAFAAALGGGGGVVARANRSLRSLNLRDNKLSDASVLSLGDALVDNASLTALDCTGNRRIHSEALAHLEALLAHNRNPHPQRGVAPNSHASLLVPSNVQRLFTKPPDNLLLALPPAEPLADESLPPSPQPHGHANAHAKAKAAATAAAPLARLPAPESIVHAARVDGSSQLPAEVRAGELCKEMGVALHGVRAQIGDMALHVESLRHREARLLRALRQEAGWSEVEHAPHAPDSSSPDDLRVGSRGGLSAVPGARHGRIV